MVKFLCNQTTMLDVTLILKCTQLAMALSFPLAMNSYKFIAWVKSHCSLVPGLLHQIVNLSLPEQKPWDKGKSNYGKGPYFARLACDSQLD